MKKIFIVAIFHLLGGCALSYAQVPVKCQILGTCINQIIEYAKDYMPPTSADCKIWHGSCTTSGEIWREGTVSIGTKHYVTRVLPSGTYFHPKLLVNGDIYTEQLQICKAAWCDYVFEDTFSLMALPEVSAYIGKNHHLPGCTSGDVIEAQGAFSLDEQALEQQQKVEESFLHLIVLNERTTIAQGKLKKLGLLATTQYPKIIAIPETLPNETNTVEPPPSITCSVIKTPTSASSLDGVVGISVTGATSPFTVTWENQFITQSISNIDCDGLMWIPNLNPSTYVFKVYNATGLLVGGCTLTLVTGPNAICDVFKDEDCKKYLMEALTKEYNDPPSCEQWKGSPCSQEGSIQRTGNVCIGTSIGKSGYSLAVAGGILAKKVRIELCSGWCDYVFDPAYQLMPLPVVKAHIKKHKSLPGMITQASVIKEGGFEIKEVKVAQQEKIEEAYLHLIQLKKDLTNLKNSLEQN